MMNHLNSLNYFSLGIESLCTQPIHVWLGLHCSDKFEGQRSNALKYPSDYLLLNEKMRNRVNVSRGTEVDIRWLKVY